MRTTLLLVCIAFFFTINSANAASFDPPSGVKVVAKDFPLFKDKDFQIIYLDFELLSMNVKSLQIVKNGKKLMFKDDVSRNEVDAIYELDYSEYTEGSYSLELHTYTGEVLNSNFIIK